MRKLVIISHTEHQLDPEKGIVGWGPTVDEINHLAERFDSIEHIACLESNEPRGGSIPYTDAKIRFTPIPPFGGRGLIEKLSVLKVYTRVMSAVREALKDATHVQLRLPMGIGLYLLPFFMLRRRDNYIFWIKYANDWGQKNPPLGFALQRWFLRMNFASCKVTINGMWENQMPHCISFENPCIEESNLISAKLHIERRRYEKPFILCFSGRLEDAKGVSRIIDALIDMDPSIVSEIHFLGDGRDIDRYKEKTRFMGRKAIFHGFCSKRKVIDILKLSDFFLLPSTASEGFPKAAAEAACYGAIPILSTVGSIPHYVKDMYNGFLWDPIRDKFSETVGKAFNTDDESLLSIALRAHEMSKSFTFEKYGERLESEIFVQ